MLNFSGQTKRRVVNLGNRKQGFGNNNFLEQSRLQRQERELAKAKEKAALVIQMVFIKTKRGRNKSSIESVEWSSK